MSYICPKCGSDHWSTYRHPYAKVWCVECGTTIREEGEGLLKQPNYKIEYLVEQKVPDLDELMDTGESSTMECTQWTFHDVILAVKKEEELLKKWNNPNVFISTTVLFTNMDTGKNNNNEW